MKLNVVIFCLLFCYLSIFVEAVPRILVVTGYGGGKKTELWPAPESQCALPDDFPLDVYWAVGFWTARGPTVCGGGISNKCFSFNKRQWMPWTNMGTRRRLASALEVNRNQALIIGGLDESSNPLKTTELISSSGSEEELEFPVTIFGHCSFPFNATHGLVTGGSQDGSHYSTNTWFVDLTTTRVTPGPTMNTGRNMHGCSIFQDGTKSYGVVAGGLTTRGRYSNRRLDSTEMIILGQENPSWTEGPKLPRGLEDLTLVGNRQGTYAMGGKDGRRGRRNKRNEVFRLDCLGDQVQSCRWREVGNLQLGRYFHLSFALPESYDICRA